MAINELQKQKHENTNRDRTYKFIVLYYSRVVSVPIVFTCYCVSHYICSHCARWIDWNGAQNQSQNCSRNRYRSNLVTGKKDSIVCMWFGLVGLQATPQTKTQRQSATLTGSSLSQLTNDLFSISLFTNTAFSYTYSMLWNLSRVFSLPSNSRSSRLAPLFICMQCIRLSLYDIATINYFIIY